MNYSRLIHDYLDGELPVQKEELLFSEIANNSAIRTDFNMQMKIHLVAKQDLAVISTPVSLTNSVFSQLGFASPSVVPDPTFSSKVYDFTKKNSIWLLLLLFVSTVSTTGYLIYQNNKLEIELNNRNQRAVAFINSEDSESKNNNSSAISENNSNNLLNATYDSSKFLAENNAIISNKIRKKNAFLVNQNSLQNGNSSSNNAEFANSFNNIEGKLLLTFDTNADLNKKQNNSRVKFPIDSKYGNYTTNSSNIMMPNFADALLNLFNYSPLDNTNYSIRIRNLQNLSNNSEFSSINNNVPFYNDLAIGSWYKIDNYHSIGVEFGMEKFAQQFKLNNGLEYLQNPEFLWAGISYRFAMKELFVPYILYPYSEVFAGATSVGPLFRVQTGLNYLITNSIGINIGVEYNALYYNVEGTIYNSNKLGVTSGINFNF